MNLKPFVALLVCLLCSPLLQAREAEPEYLLELRVHENRIDGCTNCGCRLTSVLAEGKPSKFWITFGEIRPDGNSGWKAHRSYSYCGVGEFEAVAENFHDTIGLPYLRADVRLKVENNPGEGIVLDATVRRNELAGFDRRNRPDYSKSTAEFEVSSLDGREVILPLLIGPAQIAAQFENHEVLLGLTASSVPLAVSQRFGALKVIADVPGSKVYLDEGRAGQVGGDGAVTFLNIPEGNHQVDVVDFSERRQTAEIEVIEGTTAEVVLQLLSIADSEPDATLVDVGTNPQGAREFWRLKDRALMVEIPGGPFLMGSPEGSGNADERPQHEVQLPAFLIDKHEVTMRQFLAFTKEERLLAPQTPVWGRNDNYPVTFVLWGEADAYCQWAGGRLPSEAEWEKAARGEAGFVYPWGNEWDATRCNSIAGGEHRPEAVGSFPRCLSPYGVLDMAGSVVEWTADWYKPYDAPESPEASFQTAPRLKVMRGGGWMHSSAYLRASDRYERLPTSRNMDHGFRCVFDLKGEAQ